MLHSKYWTLPLQETTWKEKGENQIKAKGSQQVEEECRFWNLSPADFGCSLVCFLESLLSHGVQKGIDLFQLGSQIHHSKSPPWSCARSPLRSLLTTVFFTLRETETFACLRSKQSSSFFTSPPTVSAFPRLQPHSLIHTGSVAGQIFECFRRYGKI